MHRWLSMLVAVACALTAACSARSSLPSHGAFGPAIANGGPAIPNAVPTPALLGITQSGTLSYFPIASKGGTKPTKLAGISGVYYGSAMAANGNTLSILNQGPPELIDYDLSTKKATTMDDPFGEPVDVAIDKKGRRFVLNFYGSSSGNVAMYAAGKSKAQKISCKYLGNVQSIAVDNEGDLFVNGYDGAWVGVVEIPSGKNGPNGAACSKLALSKESKYATGIGVDPKTDDLIVVDDPGSCYGKSDGRMTIYLKPYGKKTAHAVQLDGDCVGLFRLDAGSDTMFAFDSDGTNQSVIQRTYPAGKALGSYKNGNFSGITTLPNTLPN